MPISLPGITAFADEPAYQPSRHLSRIPFDQKNMEAPRFRGKNQTEPSDLSKRQSLRTYKSGPLPMTDSDLKLNVIAAITLAVTVGALATLLFTVIQ
jgi:hypothetical protein